MRMRPALGAHGPKAMIAVLLAWLLAVLPAAAQVLTLPDRDLPVSLVADEVVVQTEKGLVIAEGSVEIYYGERTLTASRIVYDNNTGQIDATGPIVLRDPSGATVYADAAELDADLVDGVVAGARAVLQGEAKLAAVEARRVGNRYNTLSKAVYSPCRVCVEDPTPLWRIRARRVIHDEEARLIHYEDATFDVMGIPVAWLPYFRHADPTVKRTSGFLVPVFTSSSVYGYGLKTPYYWVIDENSDATLTPFFMTDEGLILEGEYRRLFASGEMRIYAIGTVNDYLGSNRFHGALDTEGRFDLTEEIEWGWDVTLASDDGFLRRFDYEQYGDRLTSELFVRRYREDGYFDISGLYFQSLRLNEPSGQIPTALPVIDARWNIDDPWTGGEFGLFASTYSLFRDQGRDVSRLTLGADWERQVITDWGLSLTGFAEVRGDLFIVNDDPAQRDDTVARASGLAGVEARFPLVTEPRDGVVHLFEPIVQAIVAPYGGNDADIPVEDSLVTEFDETNVIDRNHFAGFDSLEEGPRVNVLLRYERMSDEGLALEAAVGRSFRFEDQPAFSTGSGLREAASDYVAAWSASYEPFFAVAHRLRFGDDAELTRNEVFVQFDYWRVEANATYFFYEEDPRIDLARTREEIYGNLRFALDENWSALAFARRDLEAGEFVSYGGGIGFLNECCSVELIARREARSTEADPSSTSVNLQIKLFTLGTNEAQER